MGRGQFLVVFHDGNWKIKHLGEHEGPFSSQKEAIRVAIKRAYRSGLLGGDGQVFVRGDDDTFWTEWSHGKDAYPPK